MDSTSTGRHGGRASGAARRGSGCGRGSTPASRWRRPCRPGDVPDRRPRQRDGREAGLPCAQAVVGVVPLDEDRQRQPDLAHDAGGDQAHPPAVVVDVDCGGAATGSARSGLLGEVVGVRGVRCRSPAEAVPVDPSPKACSIDVTCMLSMWPPTIVGDLAQVGEGDRAQDPLRLDQRRRRRAAGRTCWPSRRRVSYIDAARSRRSRRGSAGGSIVEPVAERRGRLREARVVLDRSGCPGRRRRPCRRGRATSASDARERSSVDAVVGAVEGGDADRDVGRASCVGDLGDHSAPLDRGLGRAGDDVEPVPAAVAEVGRAAASNSAEPASVDVLLGDPVLVAAGVGPVDEDVSRCPRRCTVRRHLARPIVQRRQ